MVIKCQHIGEHDFLSPSVGTCMIMFELCIIACGYVIVFGCVLTYLLRSSPFLSCDHHVMSDLYDTRWLWLVHEIVGSVSIETILSKN